MSDNVSTFCIISYKDAACVTETGRMELEHKPTRLTVNGNLFYAHSSPIGKPVKTLHYSYSAPRSLSFEICFDGTGAINGVKEPVKERCDTLYELGYKYNDELHSPAYLRVLWDTFDFKGRLTNLSFDYTMFHKSGRAVRATAYLSMLEILD